MGRLTNLSKFMSLILRHKPEIIGIVLDKHGWANVEELLEKMNAHRGIFIDMDTLEKIVATDNKQRYSFNDGHTLIKANQGHSIPVDVELKEEVPPDILYHGTGEKSVAAIDSSGLKSMSRLYVHLSTDIETATKVGKRHGNPVIYVVNAREMYDNGVKFYRSINGVWLTKYVEPRYLEKISTLGG